MNKYTQLIYDGETLNLPSGWKPRDDQMQGSSLDRLVEIAGRCCYDSCGSGRSSENYHAHIKEVSHLSVFEHANITINISVSKLELESDDVLDIFMTLLNRPGIYTNISDPQNIRITLNCRSVVEWMMFPLYEYTGLYLGQSLQSLLNKVSPLLSAPFCFPNKDPIGICKESLMLVEPETSNEIWCSIYFKNVSRGFSHELVRHGDWSAISQRSTRYVDESDSNWCWHPLIKKYNDYLENKYKNAHTLEALQPFALEEIDGNLQSVEEEAKIVYVDTVKYLQEYLILNGIDKFTARKQSRGAARGILGNALNTELLFSASLSQWQHMIKMRASEAADAEIRVVFNEVYELLSNRWPEMFVGWTTSPCKDGMGYEVKGP